MITKIGLLQDMYFLPLEREMTFKKKNPQMSHLKVEIAAGFNSPGPKPADLGMRPNSTTHIVLKT